MNVGSFFIAVHTHQDICNAITIDVSCGFDVLGLALDSVGDEMTVRKTSDKGIRISKIIGQDLPLESEKNVAGVAGLALLAKSDYDGGFEIEIDEKSYFSSKMQAGCSPKRFWISFLANP